MSCVQPEAVLRIAESLAVPKVSNDAAKALAPHIDVRLREIIQEACKFARHSKRVILKSDDINNALRLRNCESVYGFGGKDPSRFVKASGHPDLYYVEDLEVPLEQVIEKKLPAPPLDVGVIPHWLAIDGVQPKLPENQFAQKPTTKRARPATVNTRNVKQKQETGGDGEIKKDKDLQDAISVIPPIKQLLSAELQVYLDKIRSALETCTTDDSSNFEGLRPLPPHGESSHKDERSSQSEKLLHSNSEIALFASLSSDPGLHPLTPNLVDLVTEEVKGHTKNLPRLELIVKITRAVLHNTNIHIDLYLHKLMSPLLTCLVAKKLGTSSSEDHWSLRVLAAEVIALICKMYGDKYATIPQRISKQLVNAFTDSSRPLTTRFGAIVGLAKLGNRVSRKLILPHLEACYQDIQGKLSQEKYDASLEEALRIFHALQQASSFCLQSTVSDRISKQFLAELPCVEPKMRGLTESKHIVPAQKPKVQPKKRGRPKGKTQGKGKGKSLEEQPSIPEDQTLSAGVSDKHSEIQPVEDAWNEFGNMGALLGGVENIFGDAIQPFVPSSPISQFC